MRIGRFAGINVYIHFTFIILIVVLGGAFYVQQQEILAAIKGVFFILLLFLCVTLHEFGHALMARKYGVKTRDITLLPIGGLARLEDMPREPMHELWIAVAGPAVNVAIAALLIPVAFFTGQLSLTELQQSAGPGLILSLLLANIVLVVFNMLPAFPMDGGRVLRAVLAMTMDFTAATKIAARVGQGMAIFFAVISFPVGNIWLLFIALFVWIGASGEAQAAQFHVAMEGIKTRDAMITRYSSLHPEDTLDDVVKLIMSGSQEDFPVLDDNGKIVGLLIQDDFVEGLSSRGRKSAVRESMRHDFPSVEIDHDLETVIRQSQLGKLKTVPVMDGERFAGLLTLQNINELVMIRTAIRKRESLKEREADTVRDSAMSPHTPQ
jgi:Zn-dependent protease